MVLNGQGIKKRLAIFVKEFPSQSHPPLDRLPFQTSRSSLYCTQNRRWRNQMKKLMSKTFPMANKQPIYVSWAMTIKRTNGIAMHYVSFAIILFIESWTLARSKVKFNLCRVIRKKHQIKAGWLSIVTCVYFLICVSFRYDKDIGNQSFFNSTTLPFSSEYCDPSSWLLDTNSVSSAVVFSKLLYVVPSDL